MASKHDEREHVSAHRPAKQTHAVSEQTITYIGHEAVLPNWAGVDLKRGEQMPLSSFGSMADEALISAKNDPKNFFVYTPPPSGPEVEPPA